ncbi:MAG: hypothetical protein LC623_05015, partial [Halobacteriales archaeon]|nr:hypothetical protein [Halobacteriales archaeon]
SGSLSFTANLAVSRQDAGLLAAQVTSAPLTLPCPATGGAAGIDITVQLTNQGDTGLTIGTPTLTQPSVAGANLALSSQGASFLGGKGSTSFLAYHVVLDANLAGLNAGLQIAGAGSIQIPYATTRARPVVGVTLPFTVVVPVQVTLSNRGAFAPSGTTLGYAFGNVEMQRLASQSALFTETCGYRAVALVVQEIEHSRFATVTGAPAALPANGAVLVGFGVFFTPGGGASICVSEHWSYSAKGSVDGSEVYAQPFEFTAQPAFQDLTKYLAELGSAGTTLLSGSATTRAIARECPKFSRLAQVAADCQDAADAFAAHWSELANQARNHFASQLNSGANQQVVLDAHTELALVYRALGQQDEAKMEDQRADNVSNQISLLRRSAAKELDLAQGALGNSWMFLRAKGLSIAWNPLGYGSLADSRRATGAHYAAALQAYRDAGDDRSADQVQQELDATQATFAQSQLWSMAVLGGWVLVFLAAGIHAGTQGIYFLNDQRRITVGSTLFVPRPGGQ